MNVLSDVVFMFNVPLVISINVLSINLIDRRVENVQFQSVQVLHIKVTIRPSDKRIFHCLVKGFTCKIEITLSKPALALLIHYESLSLQ